MPMPKKKITSSRRGMRRSHDHISAPGVSSCPNCNSVMRPHHACPSCGYYRGREVVPASK